MKLRRGIAAVLVAAMGVVGAGCSPSPPLTQNQQQGIGNFIFMVIYIGLCQANGGVCPFPLGPSDPAPVPVTAVPPSLEPAPASPTD